MLFYTVGKLAYPQREKEREQPYMCTQHIPYYYYNKTDDEMMNLDELYISIIKRMSIIGIYNFVLFFLVCSSNNNRLFEFE